MKTLKIGLIALVTIFGSVTAFAQGGSVRFDGNDQAVFKNADLNADGKLTFKEFDTKVYKSDFGKNRRDVFNQADLDHNGFISPREIRIIIGDRNWDRRDRRYDDRRYPRDRRYDNRRYDDRRYDDRHPRDRKWDNGRGRSCGNDPYYGNRYPRDRRYDDRRDDRRNRRDVFDLVDTNNDGRISRYEYRKGLDYIDRDREYDWGYDFYDADYNRNGYIERREVRR